MNYEESVEYILGIPKFTVKNHLTHTKEFLVRLGNPQDGRKIIHVAGTNGKGSVCAYMQALLLAEGKRVGFFTSPHLVKVNERICIDGREISDDRFLEVFGKVKQVVDAMTAEGIAHPTFFEFLFGMGMTAFAMEDVEYIILETGLGGRLDATNAIERPVLTVITSVSLDHTELLGSTEAEIAAEKGGIIKEQVPLVFDGNHRDAAEVLRRMAREKDAPCREITKNAHEILEITDKHIAFLNRNAYYEDTVWVLDSIGCYQVENAMLALEAMQFLVEEKHLGLWQEAIAGVRWAGRMEEVLPGVYLDGAHNQNAVERFAETVRQRAVPGERTVILFSAVREKEYERMLAYLCRRVPAKTYVVTSLESERGVPAETLARIAAAYTDSEVVVMDELASAWKCAMERKGDDGVLYCLGSLYLVGMIQELLKGEG